MLRRDDGVAFGLKMFLTAPHGWMFALLGLIGVSAPSIAYAQDSDTSRGQAGGPLASARPGIPPYWVAPPAAANPNVSSGIALAAMGGLGIVGGATLFSQRGAVEPDCERFAIECGRREDALPQMAGIAMISSGVTMTALGGALALLGSADPLTYPHVDSELAGAGAGMTIGALGSFVGGAASLVYALEHGDDEIGLSYSMLGGAAVLLPLGLTAWFRGASGPELAPFVTNTARRGTPSEHYVTRSPTMLVTGITFMVVGAVGLGTTVGVTMAVSESQTNVDSGSWPFGASLMTATSVGFIGTGIPLIAVGGALVSPAEAFVYRRDSERRWLPKVAVGPGAISMSWRTP